MKYPCLVPVCCLYYSNRGQQKLSEPLARAVILFKVHRSARERVIKAQGKILFRPANRCNQTPSTLSQYGTFYQSINVLQLVDIIAYCNSDVILDGRTLSTLNILTVYHIIMNIMSSIFSISAQEKNNNIVGIFRENPPMLMESLQLNCNRDGDKIKVRNIFLPFSLSKYIG